MTLQEFVNTMAFGMLMASIKGSIRTQKSMEEAYQSTYFLLPRIHCKDGFNISIQVNRENYSASENGVRIFGTDWKLVEWGFPSEQIDAKKYNAENYLAEDEELDTTQTVGGYVEIELMDKLLQEHGGIDLQTTLINSIKFNGIGGICTHLSNKNIRYQVTR